MNATPTNQDVTKEALKRRTFAIISHPDAGKTTLTEKFLLYGGAVGEAGAVKSRASQRSAVSDWMQLEKERGISVSSTVLQFPYNQHVINLLDTPGHRDFSEDTYRVLSAVDAAVMVLDVAKGIEAQTLKLFEVCRARNLPTLTFLNKYDRPGRSPLELLDEIEEKIGLRPTPVTWPVGIPGEFRGVIDRRTNTFVRFARSAHGSKAATEEHMSMDEARAVEGEAFEQAQEECALLDAVGGQLDVPSFLSGETSPLFVGSALTNFGVRHLLDAVTDLAPPPSPRLDDTETERQLNDEFSGFVFKIQANMNPAHRDHVAFVRVCSGRFERGTNVIHGSTGRPFATKYATSTLGSDRTTIDEAFPGDVIGLVNASELRVGDSLYLGQPVVYPGLPLFLPELFASTSTIDPSRYKQFRRGVDQLAREGVFQHLHDYSGGPTTFLGVVGEMQLEVFVHRMENEFGTKVDMTRLGTAAACYTDETTAEQLKSVSACRLFSRDDGAILAAFNSAYYLQRMQGDHPEWVLETSLTSTASR